MLKQNFRFTASPEVAKIVVLYLIDCVAFHKTCLMMIPIVELKIKYTACNPKTPIYADSLMMLYHIHVLKIYSRFWARKAIKLLEDVPN